MNLDLVTNYIRESKHLVCLVGNKLQEECGVPRLRVQEVAYEVESKYGYSPEEILSSVFFVTRPEMFYKYYRDVILSNQGEPSDSYYALAELERKGKVKAIITRNIFGLPTRAGCKNVIELHGSVYRNQCIHCKKDYSIEDLKKSTKVPTCDVCKSIIRPSIRLYGDMVDNGVMTRSVDAIEQADVLLALELDLNSSGYEQTFNDFTGGKIILLKSQPHFLDEKADLVLYGQVKELLPEIVKAL